MPTLDLFKQILISSQWVTYNTDVNIPGGVPGNSWWRCVPGSPNPDPFLDQKVLFFTPFSDLASKKSYHHYLDKQN